MANLILSNLIDVEIPHNILISDLGRAFYIFPRKFDIKEFPINTCWNDLAGFITFKAKEHFEKYAESEESLNELKNFISQNVSMDEKDFVSLTEKITGQVEAIYEVEK